ncbi:hypothetical protein MMPV_009733 [Pyropia vietnamensis]
MPYYELVALASARTTRAGLVDLTTRTAAAFLDGGATLTRLATLPPAGAPTGAPAGPRRLAYRIRRNQVNHHYAYFLQFCAFASPATLAEVSRRLHNDDAVIRHLAVKRPLAAAVRPLPNPTATTSAGATESGDALDQLARDYFRDGSATLYELSDGLAYPR